MDEAASSSLTRTEKIDQAVAFHFQSETVAAESSGASAPDFSVVPLDLPVVWSLTKLNEVNGGSQSWLRKHYALAACAGQARGGTCIIGVVTRLRARSCTNSSS